MRYTLALAALGFACLPSLLAAPAASAQQTISAYSTNDRAVQDAVRALGLDTVDRSDLRDAARDVYRDLYPAGRFESARLSAVQARALAYLALEDLGYRFDLDARRAPQRRDDRDGNRGDRGDGRCADLGGQLYDLALAVPERGAGLFLTEDEKQALRRILPGLGRDASSCGCREVADGALELSGYATSTMLIRRSDAVALIDRMRAANCR